MVKVNGLSVFTKGKFLLRDIDFQVQRGEIYGLIGPNGAGKTTLVKALLGLVKPFSGDIRINNELLNNKQLANVGSLIERAPLYNHLRVYDNLKINAIQFGVHENRIDQVLEITGLVEERNKPTKNLSLGMKQRLGIGLAILHNPGVLILDEPTNGLDPDGIIQVRELLQSINQKFHTTILLASHLLIELEKIVTHIGMIQKGVMAFSGTLESFKEKDSLENQYRKISK